MNFVRVIHRVALPEAAGLAGRGRLAFWLLALWLIAGHGSLAAQPASPSEYQVKAAFLYNFGKFVQWPANAFTNDHAPMVIGIFGDNPFQGDLERIIAGKDISGHPVKIRYVSSAPDLKGCDIVFISSAEQEKARKMIGAIQTFGILTVTEDTGNFADSGYIISFITVDDRIHFEINNAAAIKAGLTISSKLLALAKVPEK